jgi:hypothetical protein
MAQYIGAYTSYQPLKGHPETLHLLQERFGSQLEDLCYEQKIVFRAALSGFIALLPVWKEEGNDITCIDSCIESAGVDWNIWDEDPDLVVWIQACSTLPESDIEGLIQVLTAQIREGIYSSRLEQWEVEVKASTFFQES